MEDNPVNQRLMQKVLANLGCTWTVAENGKMALDELKRVDYHVVLMDLHMPVMDGATAIAAIRDGQIGDSMRDVWIAALTADARALCRAREEQAGPNFVIGETTRLPEHPRCGGSSASTPVGVRSVCLQQTRDTKAPSSCR